MSPFGSKSVAHEQRSLRLRALADLLSWNGIAKTRLREIVADIETPVEDAHATAASRRQAHAVIAEVDTFLTTVRTTQFAARGLALAEELRAASRLCLEEARATVDMEIRRMMASRALDLAMLAEQTVRSLAKES